MIKSILLPHVFLFRVVNRIEEENNNRRQSFSFSQRKQGGSNENASTSRPNDPNQKQGRFEKALNRVGDSLNRRFGGAVDDDHDSKVNANQGGTIQRINR